MYLKKRVLKMTFNIDWDFIRKLEGFELRGYVPVDRDTNNRVQSGVTIGAGFDIGQQTRKSIQDLFLPPVLTGRLLRYVGLKGEQARLALRAQPLVLSEKEAELLSQKVKQKYANQIEKEYNSVSKVPFKSLNKGQQTVIASVGFQYGSLARRTPNFFRVITSQDWKRAYKHLLSFGDAYKNRRKQEAEYLRKYLV